MPRPLSSSLPPMFSFRSFMVSEILCSSLQSNLSCFCVWSKIVVQFYSLTYGCLFFSAPFIEVTVLFPIEYSWLLLGEIIYVWVYFLAYSGLCVCFDASSILFWYPQLCSIIWCSQLYSYFSRSLWLFGYFCDSVQILGLFVYFCEKKCLEFWLG